MSSSKKQEAKERFYDREKKGKYHKIVSMGLAYDYQCDLMEYITKTKGHQIYIMCIIDVYSRYSGFMMMKNKSAETTLETYKTIIDKYFNGINCLTLQVDGGTEFNNKLFKSHLEKVGTEMKLALSDGLRDSSVHLSNSIVERLNGTVRNTINRLVEEHSKKLTPIMLDHIVKAYNERKHSSVQEEPRNIWNGKVLPKLVIRPYNIEHKGGYAPLEFKIGDKVRVVLQFDKMSSGAKRKAKNSKEVFVIVSKDGNRYTLNNGEEYPYTRLIKSKNKRTILEGDDTE